MVLGVKGPKSILSSAIANALAEYFVVDAKTIESNLLHDTKIVLNNVLLRKQVARLPVNSAGKPTLIAVTGYVESVTFSWTWAVGSNRDESNLNAWVRDSKLTLKGLEFKAKLEYGTGKEELTMPPKSPEESTPMDASQQDDVKKQGGFQAFIANQVEMIVDSLDLDVENFKFTIEIPPPLMKPEECMGSNELTCIVMQGINLQNVSNGRQQQLGGGNTTPTDASSPPSIIEQTLSFDSLSLYVVETKAEGSEETTTTFPIVEPFSYLANLTRSSGQRFSGFATGLTLIGKPNDNASSDLVVHFGAPQFESLTQVGIMLMPPPNNDATDNGSDGENDATEESDESNADGTTEAAVEGEENEPSSVPEEDDTNGENRDVSDSSSEDENEGPDDATDDQQCDADDRKDQRERAASHKYTMADQKEDAVSALILPMKSVSLVLDGNAKIVFPLLVMSYEADGSVAEVSASACHMESLSSDGQDEKSMSFHALGLKVAARPTFQVVVNEINQIYVPNVIRLTKPIENPRIAVEGTTWSIDIDSIEAEIPSDTDDEESSAEDNESSKASFTAGTSANSSASDDAADSSASDPPSEVTTESNLDDKAATTSDAATGSDSSSGEDQSGSRPQAPFPVILSVNDIKVKNKKAIAELKELDLYLNPNQKRNGTDVALQMKAFNSSLVQCDKVNAFASFPVDQPDEIANFTFAAARPRVSAGHTTKEWQDSFKPRETKKQPNGNADSKSSMMKFPFASIAPLSLKVSWKGTGVTLRDTDVAIKPFKGDADTTSKDLVDYYVAACLSRVPGFISNADVLGVNVVDATATTYGTWLGMGLFGNLGVAGGGVAAIAAVDGVKAAVHAGKASRNAENGASWKPGDLVRGLIFSVGQATKAGAFKRGRQDRRGDLVDFIVGLSSETAGYVNENKAKLGGAVGGGVGTIVGTLVGGPVGGIIGGLVTGAVTGKAIETAEERASKKPTDTDLQLIQDDQKT